jgi:hypothetical protein
LTNGTRRRRTDGRAAFENLPNTLQPAFFIVEILNNEQEPVKGVKFSVAVDDGNAETKETDEDGIFKIPKPRSEIKLSLAE